MKVLKSFLAIGSCGIMLFGCKEQPKESSYITNAESYQVVEEDLHKKYQGGELLAADLNNTANPSQNLTAATCQLTPTQGNQVYGVVTFVTMEDGVQIVGDFTGLIPGKHGFHIHEHGDCSAPDGSSTGGHFNPTNKKHGCPDSAERHVGDLGNLVADSSGNAHYERIDKVIKLNGPDTIVGRAVVVHAGEDDCKSQPAGNSGAKISCGVIQPFR